jgi:hypothetical protein
MKARRPPTPATVLLPWTGMRHLPNPRFRSATDAVRVANTPTVIGTNACSPCCSDLPNTRAIMRWHWGSRLIDVPLSGKPRSSGPPCKATGGALRSLGCFDPATGSRGPSFGGARTRSGSFHGGWRLRIVKQYGCGPRHHPNTRQHRSSWRPLLRDNRAGGVVVRLRHIACRCGLPL